MEKLLVVEDDNGVRTTIVTFLEMEGYTVDAVSFAGVSLLFLAIAVVAAWPPSRRAMRVDPMVALRYQ